jgi:hypothetical protein
MKNPYDLSPSIENIERRLIGINEGLIQTVGRGETSPAIANAVRRSPEWAQYQADLAQDRDAAAASVAERPPPAMPAHLLDLIRRRVAAHSLTSSSIPEQGQIVRVEAIVTPRPGQLDAVLMAPLHVLLDAPAEAEVIWHGWLVAGETDYAGWWDFVLQDQDAPFDPEAAMVQVWNPVRLYLPQAARVVGRLSPARLQAVRSLAGDFATGEPTTEIAPWPGRVANRATSAGFRVVTGSPMGGEADFRHRYQRIYFEAAEAVREPARLALAAAAESFESSSDVQHLADFIRSTIGALGSRLEEQIHEMLASVQHRSSNESARLIDHARDLRRDNEMAIQKAIGSIQSQIQALREAQHFEIQQLTKQTSTELEKLSAQLEQIRELLKPTATSRQKLPSTGVLSDRLRNAAANAGQFLMPVPRVAVAMNAESGAEDLQWDDIVRISFQDDSTGSLRFKAIGGLAVTGELRVAGTLEKKITAKPDGDAVTIAWDGGAQTTLLLISEDGKRLVLPLAD